MKKEEADKKNIIAEEPSVPYRTFSSQEEAEKFTMVENLQKTDMEKFHLFCRMLRIGRMLSSAKVIK
ncbi:MAG: hypothetical protein JNM88_00835 [Chitinophagaceae bacterium]|nr:hypothetical protein [Chitinophagaceae bacterium]